MEILREMLDKSRDSMLEYSRMCSIAVNGNSTVCRSSESLGRWLETRAESGGGNVRPGACFEYGKGINESGTAEPDRLLYLRCKGLFILYGGMNHVLV